MATSRRFMRSRIADGARCRQLSVVASTGANPTHRATGMGGYLTNRGSLFDNRHIEYADRLVDTTCW